jgi:hypothetical protein
MFFKRPAYYLTLMEIEKENISKKSGNSWKFLSGNLKKIFWKIKTLKIWKF